MADVAERDALARSCAGTTSESPSRSPPRPRSKAPSSITRVIGGTNLRSTPHGLETTNKHNVIECISVGAMAETEGFEPSIGLYNPITV